MCGFAGFSKIQEEPICQTGNISYYSCRAPDGESLLLAECRNDEFCSTITALHERELTYVRSVAFSGAALQISCGRASHCFKRECDVITFLPHIVCKESFNYVFKYRCFSVSKLVQARELIEQYYLSEATAYRVAMSLAILVDRLVKLEIEADFSISNLLIDLESSYCTLLDWSTARHNADFRLPSVLAYYQDLAKIVIQLVDGVKINPKYEIDDKVRHHAARAEPHNADLLSLLTLMSEILALRYELPDSLNEAIDYAIVLEGSLESVLSSIYAKAETLVLSKSTPLYELRRKKEEKE